jgi:hypothetical protein
VQWQNQHNAVLRYYFANLDDAVGRALQFDTSDILDGSIPNSKLENSTVSFGGVTLALGESEATPAFNLSAATGYPTSSLVGTITNAQLAGSIDNSKLVNDSVSYGGVSLDLGQSDATPAFNLSAATNYPASQLTGQISTAQIGDNQVTPAKLNHDYLRADANDSTPYTVGFGVVTVTNTITVGLNQATTSGNSIVAGSQHNASSNYSMVSGFDNTVSGTLTNVSGQGNTVYGGVGITTGYANNVYSGADRTITGGYSNYVFGENALVAGNLNSVSSTGDNSIISGFNNTVSGNHCLTVGYQCQTGSSTKWFSTSLGYQTRALGNASFSGGRSTYDGSTKYTQVDADAGFAYGSGNRVYTNAPSSVALGTLTQCGEASPASGVTAAQSMAIGYKSIAYKDNSFAGGNQSYSFGNTSFSFGNGAVASNGFSNIALGRGITTPVSSGAATTIGAVSVGQFNEYDVTTEQHFSVGVGTASGSRYTSMYVGPRSSADSGIVMQALKDSASYNSDSAAGLGGVPLGGIYRNNNTVKIRMT